MRAKLQAKAARAVASKRYRLGVFDVLDDSGPLDFVGRVLIDCPEDRRYGREAIDEYNAYVARIPGCTLAMGLFEMSG
jgi:hypothetical protein